jgi:citronellol/citronellal dehydrogenase
MRRTFPRAVGWAATGGVAGGYGWATHRVDHVPADHALPDRSLKGKTLFISGASRGIGLAIALRAAKDGANVVVAAKTTTPHPKLPGTIHTAAKEIEAAGGQALAVQADVRDEASMQAAVDGAVARFGGIDIVINNASAISLTGTAATDMKRYDLMHGINTRGTFLTTKLCLPHLKKAANAHVMNLSPPLNMDPKWFGPHVAYTMAKYGMSMCVVGHADEFRADGIAVNGLWPRTVIATAAVQNLLGGDAAMSVSRSPAIMAEAAHCVLTRRAGKCSGNLFLDDEVLAAEGWSEEKVRAFSMTPGAQLGADFFL